MRESFGAWDFAVMIILTKSGRFYARMDFSHDFGNGFRQCFNVQCEVEVLWTGRKARFAKNSHAQPCSNPVLKLDASGSSRTSASAL